jgi:hypothetical protein
VGEGALTGATGAGSLAGAPTALRALASPVGQAAVAGVGTLATTRDPRYALGAAITAGMLGGKPISKAIGAAGESAASALERFTLNARTGTKLSEEAPEVIDAAGKVLQGQFGATTSSGLPSGPVSAPRLTLRMPPERRQVPSGALAAQEQAITPPAALAAPPAAPAAPTGPALNPDGTVTVRLANGDKFNMPASRLPGAVPRSPVQVTAPPAVAPPNPLLAHPAAQKVLSMLGSGQSEGQIASHLSESAGLTTAEAKEFVATVKAAAAPKAGAMLPDGTRMMATNLGGPAQPAGPSSLGHQSAGLYRPPMPLAPPEAFGEDVLNASIARYKAALGGK